MFVPVPPRGILEHHYINENQEYDLEKAIDAYTNFTNAFRNAGFVVPNLLDKPDGIDFFSPSEHNWSPLGSKLTAERIVPLISNLLATSPKSNRRFVTLAGDFQKREGGYAKETKRLCPEIFIPNFLVQPMQTIIMENSLQN